MWLFRFKLLEADVDQEIASDPLEFGAQVSQGTARGDMQLRARLEERLTRHGRAAAFGRELFHIYSLPRESGGDLVHDTRPILPNQLQRGHSARSVRSIPGRTHHDGESFGLERFQLLA